MTDFAARFRARHQHLGDFLDDEEANRQADLLLRNGLDILNDRVLASPRAEVLDVIAEHNMAAALLGRGFADVTYEPPSMQRPVDLVGVYAGTLYRIEVKRLAASENDELHSNIMTTVNTALESNVEPVVISVLVGEAFEPKDINPLVRHVKQMLRDPREGQTYSFPSEGPWLAQYKFKHSETAKRPRVIALGDVEMRDVTGDDHGRVVSKIRRAYEQFKTAPQDDAVHLLVLEADNTVHMSAVADALYGRDYMDFLSDGGTRLGRNKDGAFSRGQFSRLGGVVTARRSVRHRLFVPYTFTLFRNPGGALTVDVAAAALGVGEVVGPTDFP